MTKEVSHQTLAEHVARRMLAEMEEHGGIEDFVEKLQSFPEMYLEELAFAAIDCIKLCDCLHPRVTWPIR